MVGHALASSALMEIEAHGLAMQRKSELER